MKKIIFSFIAVMACLSINAQVLVKVFKTTDDGTTWTEVNRYKNTSSNQYRVILEEDNNVASVLETAGVSNNTVAWVQLWKNGPKWAVFNVGASMISEYGIYYSASEMTSSQCVTDKWGSNWKAPSADDLRNLLSTNYTDGGVWKSSEESGYGIAGLLITGKGEYAYKKLFLPAGGFNADGNNDAEDGGTRGCYWSSTSCDSQLWYGLQFISNDKLVRGYQSSCYYNVRAILNE